MRRFRHTSRLILTVASIGIAQILSVIEAAIALGWQGIHHVSAERTAARWLELGVAF